MKLLSFGEIVWDIYEDQQSLGGAPLNFAAHCALLGAETWIISAVGDDELGKMAMEQIKSFGVNTEYVSVLPEKETGKCLVTLNQKAVPSYKILNDVAYDYIQMPTITKADVITFGTLALRRNNNREILTQILQTNRFSDVFADVNIRAPFYSKESILFCLENATIVKISEEELPIVTETVFGETLNPKEASKKISDDYSNMKMILITKGANGSCCYDSKTGQFFVAKSEPIAVVSTVGAGDSFGAAFLKKYAESKNCYECLTFASKISALVCSKAKAVPDDMSQLIKSVIESRK